jgi:glycosyltransferase
MKVSIITATYNSAETIETCMVSVLHQTYSNIEYIIVDGQSKDETLEKVRSLSEGHQNVIVSSEPDQGIYDALNKGIQKATGDLIGFVHSDDFLANTTTIEAIVQAFKTHKVDGVYGDLHYVGTENTDKLVRNWVSQPFKTKLLQQGWMPAHPTLYLKKELYATYGGFNLNYKIAADYDFILRIFNQTNLSFYYLPQTFVKMRVGGASNRSLKNMIRKTKEDYRAMRSNKTGNLLTIILKNVTKLRQFKA